MNNVLGENLMSQETNAIENEIDDDDILKIKKVQFTYPEEDLKSERSWGFTIGNNRSYDKKKLHKGIKEIRNKLDGTKSKIYQNDDYYIYGLEKLLKNPNIKNSLKIWNTLSKASSDKIRAIYIPNEKFKKENPYSLTFPSRIIHLLKEYNWIPDQEGNFHNPSEPEFYRESVHSDFKCNNRNGWLDEIGLVPREKKQEREKAARTLGFTMEEVELFTKYKEIKKLESKTCK